ncbi:hypothetical protein TorRG33x02_087110 [Trema orientale]|uniref:Uncharacterized protein n=1 Tax=Trema orientale TaxID=63057 RepID=A0A2P5FCQ3_TREOI|nr:hypothetical protein TorRG33x02_087110 [Trema orientale]
MFICLLILHLGKTCSEINLTKLIEETVKVRVISKIMAVDGSNNTIHQIITCLPRGFIIFFFSFLIRNNSLPKKKRKKRSSAILVQIKNGTQLNPSSKYCLRERTGMPSNNVLII